MSTIPMLSVQRKFSYYTVKLIIKFFTSLSLSVSFHSIDSGETGFFHLQNTLGWAKRPMVERIDKELDQSIPVSLIYGSHSWVHTLSEDEICELRPNSYVKLYEIPKAGHHVHADQPEIFNYTVNNILEIVDENRDTFESL